MVSELGTAKKSVCVQAYGFTSAIITGSFNFTKAAEENLLVIRYAELAACT